MSGVVKAVKKAFKSKIVRTIVVAAAVWFTAGTAMAYMAAPAEGLGAAMSTSWSSMVTTTTEFFAADAAASGATEAAAEGSAMLGEGVAGVEAGSQGAMLAEQTAGMAGSQGSMLAEQAAGMTSAGEAAVATGSGAATQAEMLAAQDAGFGVAGDAMTNASANYAAGAGGGKGIVGSALGWMGENPVPTMVLGQAGAGAYEGHLLDKEQEREDAWRRSRGLMGYDWGGNYKGPSPSVEPSQAEQVVTDPNMQRSATQPQTVKRPVDRRNLPKLSQQGLIANQRYK